MINIVGAGIVGLSVAWALVRRGEHVRVFDRDEPGQGASFGNSGSLSAGSVVPLATPGVTRNGVSMLFDPDAPLVIRRSYLLRAMPWLLRFARVSDEASVRGLAHALLAILSPTLPTWERVLGEIGAPELMRVTGQLHLYPSAEAMAKDGFGWRLREALGVRTERLDRAGLLALQPGIAPRYTHAVFLPEPATIADPHGLCVRLAQALRDAGVEFVRAGVDALDADGAVRALGRAWPARASVLAAGAWSASLLRPLGVNVPLESQRGYHVQRPDLVVAQGAALERPVVAADSKTFIVPMREGIRVGGTVEFAGLDAMPTHARVALLRRCFAEVFPSAPAIAPGAEEREWMGHRPCLPDTLPVLGPLPGVPAVWAAFGHGHLGLTMSAVTGAWIADAMLGRPDPSLAMFSLDRPSLRR